MDEWERKVLAIEEANDLSAMKPEELIGNLMSYEVSLQAKKAQVQDKKNLAFHAEKEDSDSDKEDIAFVAKNFRKFLKYRKGQSKNVKKNSSKEPDAALVECFNCHKTGYYQKNFPELKKNRKKEK